MYCNTRPLVLPSLWRLDGLISPATVLFSSSHASREGAITNVFTR